MNYGLYISAGGALANIERQAVLTKGRREAMRLKRVISKALPGQEANARPHPVQGSGRIRMLRNSTGAPSASMHRWPRAGSAPVPPETSAPFTQSRTSPLTART